MGQDHPVAQGSGNVSVAWINLGNNVRVLPAKERSNIMRPPIFDVATLARLFHDKTVATMEEMKAALGTRVDMTVFRKLRQLGYHSSYSDGGRFYRARA